MVEVAGLSLHTSRSTLRRDLHAAVAAGGHHHHLSVNANKLAHLADPAFASLAHRATSAAADGASVCWLAAQRGARVERIPGCELADELLHDAAEQGWRTYLYGGRPAVLAAVATLADERGVPVVGACDGYAHDRGVVAQAIHAARPQLLLVALGTPAAERFIDRHRFEALCLGVGGTFDVLAGAVRRAPRWTHPLGLEGVWRVASEPRARALPFLRGARAVLRAWRA